MVVELDKPITYSEYKDRYQTTSGERYKTAFFGSDEAGVKGTDGQNRAYSWANRIRNYLDSGSNIDKWFKIFDASVAFHIATHQDTASDGIKQAHKSIKDARLFVGAGKVLGGIWRIMAAIRNIFTISKTLGDEKQDASLALGGPLEPDWSSSKKREKYSQVLKSDTEKKLGLASNMMSLVANTAFSVGFGGCKLIKLTDKLNPGAVSQSARNFGNKMGVVMFVNHIAGLIKDMLDWSIESLTFKRTQEEFPALLDVDNISTKGQESLVKAQRRIEETHTKSQLRIGLTTAKHALELGADVSLFVPMAAPVFAGLQLGVAGLDLICTWTGTA